MAGGEKKEEQASSKQQDKKSKTILINKSRRSLYFSTVKISDIFAHLLYFPPIHARTRQDYCQRCEHFSVLAFEAGEGGGGDEEFRTA